MPRLRRRFVRNQVYFVTNRVSYGLPFVPCLYINLLLFGVLARAMFCYPGVVVCGWVFLGNHYHGIILLKADGGQMELFMKYVDGEIAKIVNRLRGISNQNVWASRYDAQPMLTAEDVMRKMAYLYANPARANLVNSIALYPGVSTWHEFLGGEQRGFKWVGSGGMERLPRGRLKKKLVKILVAPIRRLKKPKLPLAVLPFAWKESFPETKALADSEIRANILERVSEEERELKLERTRKGQSPITEELLTTQDFFKSYTSKSYGKRSPCICCCKELRESYLLDYRAFCETCQQMYQFWKIGNFTVKFPPGAFRPKVPPIISPIEL